MKIRSRLALLALICSAIPLLVMSLAAFVAARDTLSLFVNRQLESAAQAQLRQVEALLDRALVDLRTWSGLQVMQDVLTADEGGEIQAELVRFGARYPIFAELLVLDDRGRVVAEIGDRLDGLNAQLPGSPASRHTLQGQRYQGPVQAGGAKGPSVMLLAMPIRADYDPATVVGSLVGAVDWAHLQRQLADASVLGAAQDSAHRLLLSAGEELLYAGGGALEVAALPTEPGVRELSLGEGEYLVSTALSSDGELLRDPGWALHTLLARDFAYAEIDRLKRHFALLVVVVLVLALAAGMLLGRSIVAPTARLAARMRDIASGAADLTASLDASGRDEIGALAGAFNQFTKRLRDLVREVKRSGLHIAHSSFQVAAISQDISGLSAKEQERSSEVREETEELLRVSADVAALATEAEQHAAGTNEQAKCGLAAVQDNIAEMDRAVADTEQASVAVAEVNSAAERIDQIVVTIRAIAEQTNLLALNAAIEAARAGEQGRGFAVVAEEVRSLAARTAQSTGEIADIVGALNDKMDRVVSGMDQVVTRVGAGREFARKVAESIDSMTASVARTVGANEKILQACNRQNDYLTLLQEKHSALFATLSDSASKAYLTATIGEDLYRLSQTVNGLLGEFHTGAVEIVEMVDDERRAAPRYPDRVRLTLSQGERQIEGVTRDVSKGGLAVMVGEPLRQDQALQIGLHAPTDSLEEYRRQPPLRLAGRIVRESRSGDAYLYGVALTDLSPEQQQGLVEVFRYFGQSPEFATRESAAPR